MTTMSFLLFVWLTPLFLRLHLFLTAWIIFSGTYSPHPSPKHSETYLCCCPQLFGSLFKDYITFYLFISLSVEISCCFQSFYLLQIMLLWIIVYYFLVCLRRKFASVYEYVGEKEMATHSSILPWRTRG